MPSPFRGAIRMSAFWSKEVLEVIRQPRMIVSLILGPFLILFIFGIGYSNKAPSFRTLFVAPPNSQIAQHIQEYVSDLGPSMIFGGVTANETEALAKLQRGEVDMVAVAPQNVEGDLRSNRQAMFTIYQNEVDPVLANWAQFYAYTYTTEVNRRVLMSTVDQTKADSARVKQDLDQARANVGAYRDALRAGNQALANQRGQELSGYVNDLAMAAGIGMTILGGAQQAAGSGGSSSGGGGSGSIQDLRQAIGDLNSGDIQSRIDKANKLDQDLADMQDRLNEFQNMDSRVIVSPFSSEVKSTLPIQVSATDFYAPAVLALLLQHLAITLSALSIVRERSVGTMELFRVSPVSAAETLFGKYLSYLLFGGIIAAVLTGLLIYVLRVPMLGDWGSLVAVIAAVLFTSISIGFVISLISQTETQAVQYTMLVLLASVFFGGLIMNLDALAAPVRVISGLLPTTYGIVLLRDIMLRGMPLDPLWMGLLVGLGVILCVIAWTMLRRLISRAQR